MDFIQSSLNYIFVYGTQYIGNLMYAGFGAIVTWLIEQLTYCSTALFDSQFTKLFLNFVQNVGWALFAIGSILAILELGIKYKNDGGKGNFQDTIFNIFKGFIATFLYISVPVILFRACLYLANHYLDYANLQVIQDLINVRKGDLTIDNIDNANLSAILNPDIMVICVLIFCVIKIVFGMMKRGGTLLVIVTVGTLHMFSVPRGYTDAFNGWCKQVVALCFTIFMQSILFAGTFYLMAYQPKLTWTYLGVSLVATEVPKIAQQFGFDISAKSNISTAVSMASSVCMISRSMRIPVK